MKPSRGGALTVPKDPLSRMAELSALDAPPVDTQIRKSADTEILTHVSKDVSTDLSEEVSTPVSEQVRKDVSKEVRKQARKRVLEDLLTEIRTGTADRWPDGTVRASAHMPAELSNRCRRYIADHRGATIRSILLAAADAFLREEGY